MVSVTFRYANVLRGLIAIVSPAPVKVNLHRDVARGASPDAR